MLMTTLREIKAFALRNADKPRNASELHSFLGLAVWCSKFIENFASVSAPLLDLLKKGRVWNWGQEHDLAFEAVILAPLNALGFFIREWDTYLTVDASPTATGAVLRQINPVIESDR